MLLICIYIIQMWNSCFLKHLQHICALWNGKYLHSIVLQVCAASPYFPRPSSLNWLTLIGVICPELTLMTKFLNTSAPHRHVVQWLNSSHYDWTHLDTLGLGEHWTLPTSVRVVRKKSQNHQTKGRWSLVLCEGHRSSSPRPLLSCVPQVLHRISSPAGCCSSSPSNTSLLLILCCRP